MFLILFSFGLVTQYVPQSATQDPIMTFPTETETHKMTEFALDAKLSIIYLVISEQDYKLNDFVIDRFIEASVEFDNDCLFATIDEGLAQRMFGFNFLPPYLICAPPSSLVTCAAFPQSEGVLYHVISSWLNRRSEAPISNLDDLKIALGSTEIAIITRPSTYNTALFLNSKYQLEFPSSDVIQVTDAFFEELGLVVPVEPGQACLGLFRLQDQTIVPITNSSESLMKNIVPLYHIIDSNELDKLWSPDQRITAAIIDSHPFNSTKEQREALEKLANRYPQMDIGFVYPDILDMILNQVHLNVSDLPQLVCFNFHQHHYYPPKKPVNVPTSSPDFLPLAIEYLDAIVSKEIQAIYESEPLPEVSETSEYFPKLVGDTFEKFVLDESYDCAIVYMMPDDFEKAGFIESFAREVWEKSKKTNTQQKIKFAYIDPALNSCPFGFPYLVSSPHLEFYPAKNKSNHVPYADVPNEGGLKRWLNFWNTQEIKYDVGNPTAQDMNWISRSILPMQSHFPPSIAEKIDTYLKSLPEVEDEAVG